MGCGEEKGRGRGGEGESGGRKDGENLKRKLSSYIPTTLVCAQHTVATTPADLQLISKCTS